MGTRRWVQAELRCFMCGRNLGRLVGAQPTDFHTLRARPNPLRQFQAFRPADPGEPVIRLQGNEHFRCTVCGGGVMIDDLEPFTTYDEMIEDEEPRRPRVGRPPKQFRPLADTRLSELGLAG